MLALRRMAGVAAFGLLASSCTLLSWGNNGFGQLGDGTTTQRTSPTPFAELPNWNTVAAGDSSTCATGTDATLWCWGLNNAGQLGDGTQDGHKSPHEVTTPSTDWDTVGAGHWFACATTTLDDLWCWGDNVNGQLGDGTTTRRFSPVQIGPSGVWTSVAPGYAHTCAVDWLSQLWCWGENDEGQVGNGASGADVLTPTLVAGSASWDSVAAGDGHTCGLRTDGTLWCWGDGDFGKLGQGVNLANSTTPLQVGSASDWEAVEAGDDHVCGVTTGGDLWCWGRSTKGQVGNGTAGVSVLAPAQIGSGTTWLSVELGREHSCATSAGDDLWCWGDASRGRLAQPSGGASYFTTPMQVPGPTNWSAVTSGAEHGCGITANDLLQCWGHNHVAQLGLGYGGILEDSPVPLDPAWISLAGGSSHSCRVGANGTLWCWGRNNAGQLGQGPGAGDSFVPVALGIIEWDQVAAGGDTTCAIRAGDHLRCWGAGTFGQIGDDEATDRDYPTEVIPSTGWATAPPPSATSPRRSARRATGPRSRRGRSSRAPSPPVDCDPVGVATPRGSSATPRRRTASRRPRYREAGSNWPAATATAAASAPAASCTARESACSASWATARPGRARSPCRSAPPTTGPTSTRVTSTPAASPPTGSPTPCGAGVRTTTVSSGTGPQRTDLLP